MLLEKAENIAYKNGYKKIAIISGVMYANIIENVDMF